MIVIKLQNMIRRGGWTQKEFSVMTSIRQATISEMCNNVCKSLMIRNLNKICKVLNCEIEDLIEYIPDSE